MIIIRSQTRLDNSAIYTVNKQAFAGRDAEPLLVEAIRQSRNFIPELSLVAEEDGEIVGHILFSRIQIETDNGSFPALALAPMAVRPGYQNRGFGSKLVRYGLEECKRLGHAIVIVLGHPAYYPRFGFSAEAAKSLLCPFGNCGQAWMALALTPNGLQNVRGKVVYPSAFNHV